MSQSIYLRNSIKTSRSVRAGFFRGHVSTHSQQETADISEATDSVSFPSEDTSCKTVKTGDEKVARNQCERQHACVCVCVCLFVCSAARPPVWVCGLVDSWRIKKCIFVSEPVLVPLSDTGNHRRTQMGHGQQGCSSV